MEQYTLVSKELARHLTNRYSTSFSLSSRLFDTSIREDIYAIYGFVRIADEVVDTYRGNDAAQLLYDLHAQVLAAIKTGYSVNPIVHAFATTAREYAITDVLIAPFFASMKTDIMATSFTAAAYKTYIHGSAEVIGLMCLKVFTGGNQQQYEDLKAGAMALGSAYQKVNFLRDIKADHEELGRMYFPGVTYESFDARQKTAIEEDIAKDFKRAELDITRLPASVRKAVQASYRYYNELFEKLKAATPSDIKTQRYRISDAKKVYLLTKTLLGL